MKNETIRKTLPLGFMWPVANPFLFCAHHRDIFPAGNENMEPKASLEGRNIGQDFTLKDGWRMYHGETIPGFPVHPHRGFETVTIVREGLVDHSDSHGQAGRYGAGDVQWMTAGSGLQHSEMFPLLNQDGENPAELFQLWLNLPKAKKFADPHFKMLWSEDIPEYKQSDDSGNTVIVKVIAGFLGEIKALSPAPDSWAADPSNEVAIFTIAMDPGSRLVIPPSAGDCNRTLYFHNGSSVLLNGTAIASGHAIELNSQQELLIENQKTQGYLLLLQGKPIQEPVVQYGPFVMNTQAEIQQAFDVFRWTEFGGWPWPRRDQVHPRERGRFARHKDGTEEIR